MTRRSRPESYVPPYPAFQADPPESSKDVALAVMAVQTRAGGDGSSLCRELVELLDRDAPGKPLHFDRSLYHDRIYSVDSIFIPYWASSLDQAAFWQRSDVVEFVSLPRSGDVGWWSESFSAPATSLDANYSIPEIRYGIGRHSKIREEKFHAYMGSMRDRVSDFLEGRADAPFRRLSRLPDPPNSLGRTLVIKDLPHNICFIRSGFGWRMASPDEQSVFIRDMLPVYTEGTEYLRDNPLESNCISMRQTEEVHGSFDNGIQSNAIAWFMTLRDLERWVKDHPRHQAIMKSIIGYMAAFNFQPKLNLGHEVIVVPSGRIECKYANCHEETGFLPYFAGYDLIR